ncbi:uncharacterized protein [Haliotis asinina]|uniref:uncharacterized protein isoform X1 n=1 Tax=Haliotis asinina TaxID=109174 RepID=UPI0035324D53
MKPYYALAVCAIFAMVLVIAGAQDLNLFGREETSEDQQSAQNIEKKYARLSYFRSPSRPRYGWNNRGRGRYSRPVQRSPMYGWRHRSSRPKMPWEYLPDTYCFRNRCRSNFDCCKKYNLCNPAAKLCYDCWYGHPCRRNEDCCAKYPTCNKHRGMCVD